MPSSGVVKRVQYVHFPARQRRLLSDTTLKKQKRCPLLSQLEISRRRLSCACVPSSSEPPIMILRWLLSIVGARRPKRRRYLNIGKQDRAVGVGYLRSMSPLIIRDSIIML